MLRYEPQRIEPWTFGKCEAGVQGHGPASTLPACSKDGRWLIDGVVVCGGCKRALLEKDFSGHLRHK